jgi:hypothetical protein
MHQQGIALAEQPERALEPLLRVVGDFFAPALLLGP